jgi:hypothetical protein
MAGRVIHIFDVCDPRYLGFNHMKAVPQCSHLRNDDQYKTRFRHCNCHVTSRIILPHSALVAGILALKPLAPRSTTKRRCIYNRACITPTMDPLDYASELRGQGYTGGISAEENNLTILREDLCVPASGHTPAKLFVWVIRCVRWTNDGEALKLLRSPSYARDDY